MINRTIVFIALLLIVLGGCTQKDSEELTKFKSTLESQQFSIAIQETSINKMTSEITELANLAEVYLVDHSTSILGEDFTLSYYDSVRDVTVVTPTKINVQIEVEGQFPEYVFVAETDTSIDFFFHDDSKIEFITGYAVYSKEATSGVDLGRGYILARTLIIWTDLNEDQMKLRDEFAGRTFTVIVNHN
ncbi:MAG TPA: hypothetical protein DCQ90_03185 [Erysipelotrichaceae bacterium]|nr:hypothetical protein [Erysipelotrichaceae bacterium]